MAETTQERNRKFTFGFLNTAQDSNDVDMVNCVELNGVDLDKLGLGTVQSSDYTSAGVGAPDWQSTEIVGDDFQIDGNDVEFYNGSSWVDIDDYLLPNSGATPDAPSIVLEESNGGVNFNDSGSWTNFTESDITIDGEKDAGQPTITNKVMINPSNYTQTTKAYTIKIRIKAGATTFERYIIGFDTTYTGTYAISGVNGTDATYINIGWNLYIAMDQAESYTANDEFIFNIATDLLEDGTYFYTVSQVKEIDGKEIESLYSDVESAKVSNEDNLGALIAYSRPVITITRDSTDDQWLYRKGPRDEEWYRIAIIESGSGDATFPDNILTSSLIDTKIIADLNPVSMQALLDSVDSTSWSHIFEKDNRLWAVPAQKKDVVFYSEPLAFWRWTKTNSLGFNGDFRGVASLRDPSNVSVQNTAVFVTSNGLYNVYGNGTDDTPYVRITHEGSFDTVADSLVKANNVLYMVSDGATYNDGEWGRKLYSYDLTRLTELSGIVQNSNPFVSNSKTISYVNQIGGNKLKILMSDNTMMMYHIRANGFGESNTTIEAADDWALKTATFHPQYSFMSKMMNVDKFRMEWNGTLTLEWTVDGESQGVDTYTNASRDWEEFMLPAQWGGNTELEINGDNGAILYDFFFISDK